MSTRERFSVLWIGLLFLSCGGGGPSTGPTHGSVPPPPGGQAQFSAVPVDLTANGMLTPLGSLAPPGHVLPTDHVYFYANDLDHPTAPADMSVRNVYAPATGAIEFMLQPTGTDWKIAFIATETFSFYLDHVLPRPGLQIGTIVQAGELIGTTHPGGTLDLGAYDLGTTLVGFVTPARYPIQTLHCVSPWKYFTEPIRSELYSRIRRVATAPDKDGKIDFSVPGRLVGDWFEHTVPKTNDSSGPIGWPKTVAFVYDYYDPSLVRISIGGTIAAAGVWTIDSSAPRPETVSVATGKVSYRLMLLEATSVQSGLMLVQMLSEGEIRIQVLPGSTAATGEFDGNAMSYVR